MAHELQHLDFDEFAQHLRQVFEQVKDRKTPVLVHRDGDTFRLEMQEPHDIWKGYDPERVRVALGASAGALSGVNIDQLIQDLQAQREQGPGRFD